MVSQGILPYDNSEGLNEEEAQLAAGRVIFFIFILLSVDEHFATGDDLRSPHRHSCPGH